MKKETLVSLFISIIMVMSVLGFVMEENVSSEKINYNGKTFRFSQEDNRYHTEINGQDISFYYSPENSKSVNISPAFFDAMFATKLIYFTADFNDTLIEQISLASYDISKTIPDLYLLPAYTTNETQLPAVSCANATEFVPVVYFKHSEAMNSTFENNCLTLEVSSEYDITSFRDRILYGFFGVI